MRAKMFLNPQAFGIRNSEFAFLLRIKIEVELGLKRGKTSVIYQRIPFDEFFGNKCNGTAYRLFVGFFCTLF